MSTPPSFSEKITQTLQDLGREKIFSKGEFLTREGEVEHSLYLIVSGAVRVCYLTELEEHTIRLGYSGSFINSLASFITDKPSDFYIEALRKTTVKYISKAQLMQLVMDSPENMQGYIQLLESLVTQQMEREIDLLITSPAERLQRVLERSPHLFQEVPLKYIASYLRMTPETLSRIWNS